MAETTRLGTVTRSTSSVLLRPDTLRVDFMAGLSVALMAIPQSMAYALIAGLPVTVGLYASILPPIVAAFFGSSRYLVTGPTNATSMLIFSLIAPLFALGMSVEQVLPYVFLLSVIAGGILIAAGLLKLGEIIRYVAQSAMTGFLAGAGILIILGQVHHSLGIYEAPRLDEAIPSLTGVIEWLPATVRHLLTTLTAIGQANWRAVLVFVASFGMMWGILRYNRKLPAVLMTLAVITLVAVVLGWTDGGVAIIRDTGEIPVRLPPWTGDEVWALVLQPQEWGTLFSGGAALALLGMIEAVTISKGLAARTGDRLNVNRELVGQGLSKVAAGISGGMVPSGSQTRSALNMLSGAQTRFGQIASGLATLVIVLLLARPAAFIPIPALAAVVIYSALGLIDTKQIRRVFTGTPGDAAVLVATLLAATLLRLDRAIYVGAALSVIIALRRTSRLVVSEMILGSEGQWREREPDERTGTSAIVLLQIEGALYFGAAEELIAYLRQVAANGPKVIILRLKRAHHLDATVAENLRTLARDWQDREIQLILCGLRADTAGLVERMGLIEAIGKDNLFLTDRDIFGSVHRAVERGRQLAGDVGGRPMLRREPAPTFRDWSI